MRKRSEPGLSPRVFKTRDAAETFLSQLSDSIKCVQFTHTNSLYELDYAGGSIGHTKLHRGSHSGLSCTVRESGEFHFLQPLKSSLSVTLKGTTIEGAQNKNAIILAPDAAGQAVTAPQFAGISLFASANSLNAYASKLIDPDHDVILRSPPARTVDLADPLIDALARNTVSVFHEMMTLGQRGLNAVASAHFDDLLLGMMAAAVSADVRSALQIRLDGPAPGDAIVRRAQEHIRAHCGEPIRLADLAQSLGVGLRSLQIAFRRQIGCSPREFLQRCRLDAARRALLSARPTVRIANVALDAGFTDLGHFSRSYRQAYGELPSETLRRQKA